MARLATGMKGSGAQGLLGSGDFLISLNAELLRFQAGSISSSDIGKAVELINSWASAPRSQEVSLPQDVSPLLPQREREHLGPENLVAQGSEAGQEEGD